MSGKRIVLVTAIAAAAVAGAVGAPAGAAPPAPRSGPHQSSIPAPPAWLSAMTLRSDELNRRYGLGKYGLRTAGKAAAPSWLMELRLRSDALNRAYRLGKYANGRSAHI